jgi:hypothetical protein
MCTVRGFGRLRGARVLRRPVGACLQLGDPGLQRRDLVRVRCGADGAEEALELPRGEVEELVVGERGADDLVERGVQRVGAQVPVAVPAVGLPIRAGLRVQVVAARGAPAAAGGRRMPVQLCAAVGAAEQATQRVAGRVGHAPLPDVAGSRRGAAARARTARA